MVMNYNHPQKTASRAPKSQQACPKRQTQDLDSKAILPEPSRQQ